MDRERQQVQTDQDGGKILLSMPEVVLIAFGLEDVEGLVLDLPPRPTAGGELGDRVRADRQICYESVAIRRLAPGVDDLDVQPVDPERILAVSQRHVMQPW
jgi:hypothetical protein